MQPLERISGQLRAAMVPAGLAVIAAHAINASLFHIDAPFYERLLWLAAIVAASTTAAYYFPSQSRAMKGAIALSFGFPALLFGIGIHASHVYQLGFNGSDFTGIPMLLAGLLLTAIGATVLVRLIHTWWRRLLLVPAGLAFAFFVVFPVTLSIFAINVAHVPCCDETPAGRGLAYEDVTFETEQGRDLSAWFIASKNGAVVVTVHGAGSNRSTVMDEAEMLVKHGYGVLMVDVEGYGNSEGRMNAFGWAGARDVHAATAYLKSRSDVDANRIGGLGLSMGGEVLLHAAGESTDLKVVVAEGATSRTRDDVDELPGPMGLIIVPFWEVIETSIQLMTGEAPPPPLKDLVRQIAPRRVLLIAAALPEEQDLMALYVKEGGPSFEMWSIPESKHVGGFDLHREEYEQHVVAFFDDALLGNTPNASPQANSIP